MRFSISLYAVYYITVTFIVILDEFIIYFQGGREVDDFLNYIAKHATKELKGWDRSGKPKADKTEL